MNQTLPKTNRIDVIDALRGFAIVAILLLHNIEHFDFYFAPEHLPEWMRQVDRIIWDSLFFLFGGKAYSIFAILFGFTFYLQFTKQKERGGDFSGRFAWRLLLLFGFGLINTAFYVGDILLIYSIIGLVLIPVRNMQSKHLILVIIFLLSQPIEWINLILTWQNISVTPMHELFNPYFQALYETMKDSSFINMSIGNFQGKPGHLIWYYSAGRVTQTAGLFMIGLLLGREKRFYTNSENTRFWKKTLLISLPLFILLHFIDYGSVKTVTQLWSNLAFTSILVSSFILLYQKGVGIGMRFFVPLGRMSLSSYIMQSFFGSFVYYGYGLALYQYTGASLCVLIGLMILMIQWAFCKWWLGKYKQGPFEIIWHRLTWIKAFRTE
ncbi:MAG: DUF418 domain-containing protein [Bacteroidales bacterium]